MQINSARNFGGGEKHLVDLSQGLTTRGHEISFAVRKNSNWLDRIPQTVKIINLPLRNALDFESAFRIAKIVERDKIEIVHAHLARDYSIAAFALRLTSVKVKLVLTRHVLFSINRLHKFLLPAQTKIIAVSKAVRDKLLEQKTVAPQNIALIYNGVNTQLFERAKLENDSRETRKKLGLHDSNSLVGIVGEITAHKGQTDFVKASAKILSHRNDVDFIIVGRDGSKFGEHQAALNELINELNIKNHIQFLGWRENIAEILAVLTIFVSASRVEPFGLAIVEAMASRCAIVSTQSEGAKEILTNGETAKIVEIGDVEGLANSIDEFLSNENSRLRFGNNAQISAREKFNLLTMIDETEKLYAEVAAS